MRINYRKFLLIFVAIGFLTQFSWAEEQNLKTFDTPRFILHLGAKGEQSPAKMPNADQLAFESLEILNDTYDELSRIFQIQPQTKTVLRFLSPSEFQKETGAPSWTSAMFFRGEITVPISKNAPLNFEEIKRALRHEYVHAVIAEISGYSSPAWLDEGIAQLIEGKPNPLLGPALRRWIKHNEAMPLTWLEHGFTGLNSEIVPAAYAQSLFVTRSLINTHGFQKIVYFLTKLSKGSSESEAFKIAFGVSQEAFEDKLTNQIKRWSKSTNMHP